MIRCLKTDFKTSKENLDKLFACNRISAMVWNKCLDLAKRYRIVNDGAWIQKGDLQKELKDLYPLHSQSVQAITDRYCDARDGAKAARDKGLSISYPWRNKHAYPTRWKQGIKIQGQQVLLPLGTWNRHRLGYIKVETPKSTSDFLKDKKVKTIDLIWDNRLKLAICFDDSKKAIEAKGDTYAGIDLGEIHSISAACESGHAVIVTGRKLRSINRFRNKKLAEISKKQSRYQKHSRQWKKLQRAKRYMLRKADAQVRDITHKISKAFVDWAVDHKVKHVYVGNPEGVQRNTRKSKKKNKGRKQNQKLSNWNFGQLLQCLEYKLKLKGISLKKISEAYSTQTCPVCGQRHKPNGRNYRCSCGYTAHRDIHGAINILSLGLYEDIRYIADVKKTKYLRST